MGLRLSCARPFLLTLFTQVPGRGILGTSGVGILRSRYKSSKYHSEDALESIRGHHTCGNKGYQ
jgi:hypothetical protein